MKSFHIRFSAFVLLLGACCALFSAPLLYRFQKEDQNTSGAFGQALTVVLDAGHGGEDGGAISANGRYEKDLNLAVTLLLSDLLKANGVNVRLTRATDTMLYDRDVDYHGRKKALDLAARRKIAEETDGCVFVSIHMNAFPQSQYSGLQVWYSANHPSSLLLASLVQERTHDLLQPQNNRRIKEATSSIYLLHHLTVPSILIECGFLSNPQEAERLASASYQKELAFTLFLALTDGIEKLSAEIATGS